MDELNKIFNSVRLTKNQKELLKSNFLFLKELTGINSWEVFKTKTIF